MDKRTKSPGYLGQHYDTLRHRLSRAADADETARLRTENERLTAELRVTRKVCRAARDFLAGMTAAGEDTLNDALNEWIDL